MREVPPRHEGRGQSGTYAVGGVHRVSWPCDFFSIASVPLCASDVFTDARQHHQATWCLEFWLNRYQVLLGAAVAVLAAFVAWIIGERQISRTDAALEIARRQTAAVALDSIVARRSVVEEASRAMHIAEESIAGIRLRPVREILNRISTESWTKYVDKRDSLLRPLSSAKTDLESDIAEIQARSGSIAQLSLRPLISGRVQALLRDQAALGAEAEAAAQSLHDELDQVMRLLIQVRTVMLPGEGVWPGDAKIFGWADAQARVEIAICKCDSLELIVQRIASQTGVDPLGSERASLEVLIEKTIAQIEGRVSPT